MNNYVEVTLIPTTKIKATHLMNAVYSSLHKAFCCLNSGGLGVSFPKTDITLGTVVRVHGDKFLLKNLQNLSWLGAMSGYCKVSDILHAPTEVKYRTISRKQPTMSQSKLNRLIKRGSITADKARDYKVKMLNEKSFDDPYLDLVSSSNGQRHRRYIAFGTLLNHPVAGDFDHFGLSKTATVPWF